MTRRPNRPARKSFPHHVSLYLDARRHRQLRQLVKQTGIDASKHLRAALDLYFEDRKGGRRRDPTEHDVALPTGEQLPVMFVWSD